MQWADSVVLSTHLDILERHGYKASKTGDLRGFGSGLAMYLVEASWEPTWEPEDRLCQNEAHQLLVRDYKATHLDCDPQKMWAINIDQRQPKELQQGLDAKHAPCNAYHLGLKSVFMSILIQSTLIWTSSPRERRSSNVR